METTEALGQQDRLQLLAEKRKWQTEIENKKRQLEDDRRALQHLKSKALRERWLLEGAPSAGPEQDDVRRQLEQDEAKTRSLEDTINRLEQELVGLESGAVCQTIKPTAVTSGSVKAVEVKGHGSRQQDRPAAACQVVQEVKVQKSPRMNKPREATEEMKRAMYSVEIKVERDRLTGETRVLSTHTKLPVDLHQGVKVYEDERKVVHEMNGEDAVLLSSSEVDELIHKADEASMMSQTIATVTSLPTAEEQEEAGPEPPGPPEPPQGSVEITGLEAEPEGEPGVAEASEEKPVTMVFMGYQSVEDEDQTKRVLGLQGTVKAELVLIDDTDGKTSPGEAKQEEAETDAPPPSATTPPQSASTPPPASTAPPPASTAPPPVSKPPAAAAAVMVTPAAASNGETRETEGTVQIKKDKQPCKCCSIM